MQEELPAFVLSPEATKQSAMNETPTNPEGQKAGNPASDEQLMLAFSEGAAEAFAELFARHKQPVFGFFRRRVADPGHAEELTEETFLAIVRGAARYQPRALFRTYLFAIGFKILRAHRRRVAIRATFFGAGAALREPGVVDGTDAAILLRHAVEKLERTEREVLMLREFEQLSYSEIAELLSLPVNTIRSRLFRAITALRELLSAPAPKAVKQKLAESEERA